MDFNNGLYVFNGIPGFDASKGERIVKALQKVQAKIKHLEQVRKSEKETTKEVLSVSDKDLTITDVQFKLLVLQLQYLRAILRKKVGNRSFSHDKSESVQQINVLLESNDHNIFNYCKETQTGMSLCEPPLQTSYSQHAEEINDIKCTSATVEIATSTSKDTRPVGLYPKTTFSHVTSQASEKYPTFSSVLKDSQKHYHLKFDDVPFILGASSSASHNIVANVQNIIAMMKTHNKALCGSKTQVSRNTPAFSVSRSSSQDTNRMLKNLSQDLTELQLKQFKLIERFDVAQNNNHLDDAQMKSLNCDSTTNNKPENKKPPYSGLTEANVLLRGSRCNNVKKKENHTIPSNRLQANLAQIARHRLLRSIQEFKTHLSEEDLSWD